MWIVISDKPGQLGNSLFLYASFLAYGKEHHVRVLNPAFANYAHYFSFTASGFRILSNLGYRLANLLARASHKLKLPFSHALDWNEHLNLDDPKQSQQLKKPLVFVRGWLYRSNVALIKHKKEICAAFTPAAPFQQQLDDFFEANIHSNDALLIGLHVRRGDYKTFENGRYFYSLDEYKALVARLPEVFPDKRMLLLVCSNETFPLETICPDNITAVRGPGHELLDMYSLAHCHYLLGPPSTYTMWASFYGNVPLCEIKTPNQALSVKNFKVFEPQ